MDDQTIERYLEVVDILKSNKDEMKPLRKEKKDIENMLIESGKTEFTHYGMKVVIEPKKKEKINKDQAEALISKAVHSGEGKFEDYYDITDSFKVKVEEMAFDSNESDSNAI